MSKLSNVKGRINYITSHARQENLYATYQTADSAFWSALAKEAQIEFKRSNVEGKCIEARVRLKMHPKALPKNVSMVLAPQRRNAPITVTEYMYSKKTEYGTDGRIC